MWTKKPKKSFFQLLDRETSVLSVRELRKVYSAAPPFVAVDDISFDVAPGEILGLLGPNGSGKTTTIQMLLSTLKPTSGTISYFGKDFQKNRSDALQHVVFASTYTSFPKNLTVEKNLEIFAGLYGIPKKVLSKRVDPFLEKFGILSKKKRLVGELSAGQVTRLVLARAFMVHPKIVLLDEPTASLDPHIAHEVIDFILQQRKELGTAILFTSHNMAEVAEVCDRVLFLRSGKIIADGTPKTLALMAKSARLELVLTDGLKRAISLAEQFKYAYTVDNRRLILDLEEKQIAQFLSALAASNVLYTDIQVIPPSLEDYFLKIAQSAQPSCCL